MRDIKFRGLYKGIFVYGNLIQGIYDGKPFTQIENTDNNDFEKWDVDPETVGEYPGLKDKGGFEIYEGDILQISNDEPYGDIEPGFKGVVKLVCGQWIADGIGTGHAVWQEIAEWEIVGNVYEHPELCSA